jgi:hypothetical protein
VNAATPSDETKARFAELARKYEPKLPRKFAQMMPFKEWIRELRSKGASCDDIRTLLADVNVTVANDTVHRFCRDMLGNESRRGRKKRSGVASQVSENGCPQPRELAVQSESLAENLAEQRGRVLGPWTPRKRGPRIADSKNL